VLGTKNFTVGASVQYLAGGLSATDSVPRPAPVVQSVYGAQKRERGAGFRDSVGSYGDELPKDGWLTLVVRVFAFLQALFSLSMLFLIGLGLRNFFRL